MPFATTLTIDEAGLPIARGLWSEEEHERFLEALRLFPRGPWRSVAEFVGTRSAKQVQSHAQKFHQKIVRHTRGLKKQKQSPIRRAHRVNKEMKGRIERRRRQAPSTPCCSTSVSKVSWSEPSQFMANLDPIPFIPNSPALEILTSSQDSQVLLESLRLFLE